MKQFIFLVIATITLTIGCKKATQNEMVDVQPKLVAKATNVLTVTNKSNRNLVKGGIFVFELKVTNGGTPVKNAVVGVEDPISAMSKQFVTNSNGIAICTVNTNSTTKSGLYQYRFILGGNTTGITSTVAVVGPITAKLSKFTNIDLVNYDQAQSSFSNISFANRVSNFHTQTNSAVNANLITSIGYDIYDELKNSTAYKTNLSLIGFSCGLTPVVPALGTVCKASIETALLQITTTTAKVIAKKAIAKSNLTTAQKTACNTAIDATTTIFGVATLKLKDGITTKTLIDANALLWDFKDLQRSNIEYNTNGTVKGVTMAGTIVNSINQGELCVISLLRK